MRARLLAAAAVGALAIAALPAAAAEAIVISPSPCTTTVHSVWTGRVEWRTTTRSCNGPWLHYTCHRTVRITPNGKVREVENTCASIPVPR